MCSFDLIKDGVISKLEAGLPASLTYHHVGHTLDVLEQAIKIAQSENIQNEDDLLLLKVSALYHDVGFITGYQGHEELSCNMASRELEKIGFNHDQVTKVCGMIRATKVPQQPQNKLEEIICDADLDYLGRPDFFSIGEGLYKEFLDQGIVADRLQWNLLQIRFLESHHYFTETSKQQRLLQKQHHLQEIKSRVM